MIITIDGPTASGKSSAAKELAKQLGFHCLSSGALFRALAYILIDKFGNSVEYLSHPKVEDINAALDPKQFEYRIDDDNCGTVWFDNENITPYLKSVEISQGASILATHKIVRNKLDDLERSLVDHYNIVVEGRDIGSVVFPNADRKFYITASLNERSKRWQQVQKKLGKDFTLAYAKAHIEERDKRDQEREIAPLVIPENAIVIDNTHLDLQGTVDIIMSYL
jgi:CMP/dCMP kinase